MHPKNSVGVPAVVGLPLVGTGIGGHTSPLGVDRHADALTVLAIDDNAVLDEMVSRWENFDQVDRPVGR